MQILSSLVFNDDFVRKTIPYIKKDYFKAEIGQAVTFKFIKDHFDKYNKLPTQQTLLIDLQASGLNENVFEQTEKVINELKNTPVDLQWLVDTTEDFCKKQAFYNAIEESSMLIDNKDTSHYGKALDIVKEALSVSFDNYIGHDYIENAQERFESYRRPDDVLPSGLDTFNRAINGGFLKETLTVFIAPTGVGKSLFLGHFAADFLMQGKNVLYITLEMSEEAVARRIDASLLDIPILDLKTVELSTYMSKVLKLKQKTCGKLIVKGYPAHTAHSGHFRHLINELRLKKNFKPDAIMVDYIGICASARAPKGANSHDLMKSVAEEIRSLGQEFGCRTFTGAQVTREGAKTNDFDMTDTAGSWGIPATADYMFGISETPELKEIGHMMVQNLKFREGDKGSMPKFLIGRIGNKMRLHDIEQQEDERPVFDRGTIAASEKKSRFQSLMTT